MTDQTNTPKKSKTKLFVVTLLILFAVGLDYCKFHLVLGAHEVVTDSSSIVASTPEVPADSIKAVTVAIDTTKK